MTVRVPFSLLGKGSPSVVEVRAAGNSASVATNKTQVIINSLLVISAILIIIVIGILIKLKKITFNKIFATIASRKQKIHERFSKKTTQDKSNPRDPPRAS
jgi:hypothetical protein